MPLPPFKIATRMQMQCVWRSEIGDLANRGLTKFVSSARRRVRAIGVDVDRDKHAAMKIYRAIGLLEQTGQLMLALPLGKPLLQVDHNNSPRATN